MSATLNLFPEAMPKNAAWWIHRADAIALLKTLGPESVDCIVTDPAYESLEKHRQKGTTTRLKQSKASSNLWFPIFPNQRFPELFRECYRVLRCHRHFYCYCDQETMFVIKPMAEAAGFKFWKPLVWDKEQIGMGYHYRARYELILFFEKGKRKLNDLGMADIIRAKLIRGGYPTEKPVSVSQALIEQSTREEEIVIDPFMGSGSVGEAAVCTMRRFIGGDVSLEALQVAERRLTSLTHGNVVGSFSGADYFARGTKSAPVEVYGGK